MEREATENTAVTQSESPLKGLVDRIPYWVRWSAIPALITALVMAIGWEGGREFPIDYGERSGCESTRSLTG